MFFLKKLSASKAFINSVQVLAGTLISASTLTVISNSKEGEMCQKSGDDCSKDIVKDSK
jgi:hypothetical protein